MTAPHGRFHEIVNAIKEPGEEGIDPSIYDDLTAEYTSTFENYTESVRKRDEEIAALKSTVGSLKSQNFDLLMRVDTGASTSEDQTIEDESTPTIETLFVKRK